MSKLRLAVFVFCVAFLVTNNGAWADAAADSKIEALQKENELLKQRTQKLEQEMAELKQMIAGSAPTQSQPIVQTPPVKLTEDDYKKIIELTEAKKGKTSVWSNLDAQLYGFARLDTLYDTEGIVDAGGGSIAKWVSPDSADNSDHFKMTGRVTRFGLNISGPEDNGLKTSGKIEVDFAGDSTQETSNVIRMRQAYLKMDWKEHNFSLLAGQAWDLVSPLNPSTLDFGVLWWTGNLGLRRPQLRATQLIDLGQDSTMSLAAAITRSIGGISDESGARAGIPALQGRVGLTTNDVKMGISGHWGREENNTAPGVGDYNTWSVNGDLSLPLGDGITLMGECFLGENLSMLAGGIGQGVNTTGLNEIQSQGGWLGLKMKPSDKWTLNTGYGIDSVNSDDVNSGDRTQNQTIFGNAIYALNKNTSVALEAAYRRTAYKAGSDADALRLQSVFTYKF